MAPPDPAYLSNSFPALGPLLQEAHSELCFSNAVSMHTFSPSSGFWAPYTTTQKTALDEASLDVMVAPSSE